MTFPINMEIHKSNVPVTTNQKMSVSSPTHPILLNLRRIFNPLSPPDAHDPVRLQLVPRVQLSQRMVWNGIDIDISIDITLPQCLNMPSKINLDVATKYATSVSETVGSLAQ